jgi:hypothetical protein
MKTLELLNSLNIQYVTEGHKHCRPGWVNMQCPFCQGNIGAHLGFDLENEFFKCWRCGWHPILETLHKLSGLPIHKIKDLIRVFGGRTRQKQIIKETVRMKAFQHPSGTSERLLYRHRSYLEKRNFDPDKIEEEWKLKGTEITSKLDHSDYGNRILIPIYWGNQEVSFQCRAVNNKEPKYKACPQDRELIPHKHILYGKQSEWRETGICVEGVTDVWRFGSAAFATFGIEYKIQQVKEMCKNFRRIAVCFDDDPQAIVQANKLVAELRMREIEAFRVPIVGDPGAMNQADANYLVKEIIK